MPCRHTVRVVFASTTSKARKFLEVGPAMAAALNLEGVPGDLRPAGFGLFFSPVTAGAACSFGLL